MPRIKIDLPENFIFTTQIPVRITDVNYGGHVGNDSILSIIHEARVQFLSAFGYSELDFGGIGLIMSDVGIEFISESFYGDSLKISVGIGDIKRVSFDLYYLFETDRNGEKQIVAKAKTGMICFNYEQRKVASIPEKVLSKLSF